MPYLVPCDYFLYQISSYYCLYVYREWSQAVSRVNTINTKYKCIVSGLSVRCIFFFSQCELLSMFYALCVYLRVCVHVNKICMPFLKEIGHWCKVEAATNFATSGSILDFMSKFILSEVFFYTHLCLRFVVFESRLSIYLTICILFTI